MSISSVTSRIKEIQSQISLVQPRAAQNFSTVLDNETETKSDDKQQSADFTPLTPMQNDTSSSILQALIKNLSENNTNTTTTEAFDPNCQECVAELAAKNGYVKADTQQTEQNNTVSVDAQDDVIKSIVLSPEDIANLGHTTQTTQSTAANQTQVAETDSQPIETPYTPLTPGVITLEDQKNMTVQQLVERTGLSADYFALTAIPSVQTAQDTTALNQQVQSSVQTQGPATQTSAELSQNAVSQQVPISLPLGYSCPVDYSVSLPAEYQGAAQYMDIIKEASARYGMPVNLIVGIMKAESDFDNSCVSYAGAKGLMQLMPETAAEVGVTDVFNPRQNILGSVEYITKLINKYGGDVRLALAGYNTGPGNIQRKGVTNSANQNYTDVPESIRDYADRVLEYAGYVKNT